MATEGQINALSNWLKVTVKQELDFEAASDALARLHEASEKYNENKSKNKGIISETKRAIIKELKDMDYLQKDEDQTEIQSGSLHILDTIKGEDKSVNGMTGPGDAGVNYDEEGFIIPGLQKYEQKIINEVVVKLSACTVAAKELVDKDYQDLTLTDNGKSTLRHAVAATIFIQATKGGL